MVARPGRLANFGGIVGRKEEGVEAELGRFGGRERGVVRADGTAEVDGGGGKGLLARFGIEALAER